MRRWIPVVLTTAAFALVPLSAAGARRQVVDSAPSPFSLVFDGHHVVATFPSPTGLSHVGTFTTNDPLCPSGAGENIAETDDGVATRLFTCDGSGAITAGTGPLADLRGRGTFHSDLVSSDRNDFITIVVHSAWTGTAALDAAPPTLTLTLTKATATRLERRAGAYKVSVALTLTDAGGGPVGYTLTIVDPATLDRLARRTGSTSGGPLALTYTVKPRARTRAVRVEVDAGHQVGNQTTLERTIRLTS